MWDYLPRYTVGVHGLHALQNFDDDASIRVLIHEDLLVVGNLPQVTDKHDDYDAKDVG